MKRLSYFFLLACMSTIVWATDLSVDYRAVVRVGGIMPDGKVYKSAGLTKDGWLAPTLGAEFAVTFHPEWQSCREWNNAGIGVALSYWNLGMQKRLGDAVAPYVFLDIPLVKTPHFLLGLRPGFGAAFATKTYTNTVPDGHLYVDVTDANQSIGSVFNFYFPEALYMEFPIKDGWSITVGGGWYHMSNGSIRQPNSGYNIFCAELGARYTPAVEERHIVSAASRLDAKRKKWELEMSVTAGARQVYYRDQQTFFCGAAQVAAYWRAHNIFRLGGGVDAFYDGSYVPRDTKFGKTDLAKANPNGSDCWRLGLSLQPEFVFGQFTAGFHVGFYLLDPVKEMEPYKQSSGQTERQKKGIFYSYDILNAGSAGYADGWLYTQIVLRYHLPWHFFIQGSMKAHITKVEFVSLGLGAWI